MPEDQAPPSIGIQLAQALRDTHVSQRQLAQRLAASDDVKKIEAKRRWLGKILAGRIKRPGMGDVERALKLPSGYFQFPTPAQAQRRRDRLEELEDEVAQLRIDLDRFVRAASERRAELEEDQEIPTQQEVRPSSQDEG